MKTRGTILAALLGAAVASAVPQTRATADAGSLPSRTTVTAIRSNDATRGLTSSDGPRSITCTIRANNPHRSTHVPGTVNATTTVTCSYTVEKISIGQALYRGGWIVKSSSATSTWRTNARSNAAVTCAAGSYLNDSTAVVTFPLGYAPRILSGGDRSVSVSIRCS